MLQVRRVGPYDPNLLHPARRLGQLYDTVHVQSPLYCNCYNLATHKPIFMMIQTTSFLADEHLKKLTCQCRGGWLFCAPPPGQSGQRKKHRKKVFAIFKRKIIIMTYMTFVRMNYVFEFTLLLRTSISLVNTCVHFCFLDAMYKMPWLHGKHNSQF